MAPLQLTKAQGDRRPPQNTGETWATYLSDLRQAGLIDETAAGYTPHRRWVRLPRRPPHPDDRRRTPTALPGVLRVGAAKMLDAYPEELTRKSSATPPASSPHRRHLRHLPVRPRPQRRRPPRPHRHQHLHDRRERGDSSHGLANVCGGRRQEAQIAPPGPTLGGDAAGELEGIDSWTSARSRWWRTYVRERRSAQQ